MNILADDELEAAYEDGYDYTPDEGPYNKQALRAVQAAMVARVVERLRELEANEQAVAFRLVGESRLIARARMDAFGFAAGELEG